MAYIPLKTNYYEEVSLAEEGVPMVEAGHAAWKGDRLEDLLAASRVPPRVLELAAGLSPRQARTLHGALRSAAELAGQSQQRLHVYFFERRYEGETDQGGPYHYVYVREEMPRAGLRREGSATDYRLAVLFL